MRKDSVNIRAQEDELFEYWRQKPGRTPFVIDGAPFPDLYEKSLPRTLFILKDCNLGNYDCQVFRLREQMENNPSTWWSTVANWGQLLRNLTGNEPTWNEVISAPIQRGLERHTYMQLKKKPGGGRISDAELWRYAKEDSEEIRKQIRIYSPHIIVAAGTGRYVKHILNCSDEIKKTPRGIGYWAASKQADSACYIIDFCHPSNRAGLKVSSALGYGLRDACIYLEELRQIA